TPAIERSADGDIAHERHAVGPVASDQFCFEWALVAPAPPREATAHGSERRHVDGGQEPTPSTDQRSTDQRDGGPRFPRTTKRAVNPPFGKAARRRACQGRARSSALSGKSPQTTTMAPMPTSRACAREALFYPRVMQFRLPLVLACS